MEFPVKVSEWKICDCEKADWQVISISIDNIEERCKVMFYGRELRKILKEMEEGRASRKQYILKIRCRQCGFTWSKYITERMLDGRAYKNRKVY